jgi:hypothetical protein
MSDDSNLPAEVPDANVAVLVQSRESFRDGIQGVLQTMAIEQLELLHEHLSKPGQSIPLEERRKTVDMLLRYTGAEPDKKVDPNANLPTFNFVINGGQVQATMVSPGAQAADPLDALEGADRSNPLVTDVEPRAVTPVPEVDDLMGSLDDMLGFGTR